MNCQVGDTARIIFNTQFPENEGKLVHVDELSQIPGYWKVTTLCRISTSHSQYDSSRYEVPPGHVLHMRDSILRPIRDRGDDAVDETLRHSKPANYKGKDVKVTPVTVEAL